MKLFRTHVGYKSIVNEQVFGVWGFYQQTQKLYIRDCFF